MTVRTVGWTWLVDVPLAGAMVEETVVADVCSVTAAGALVFISGGLPVKGYAPGYWLTFRRVT